MNDVPRIGVLLCAHNGGAYIDEQLASLAAQEQLPHCLEIHDWGSSDDSCARVQQWLEAERMPAALFRHPQAPGPCASFIRSLELMLQRHPELTHVMFCDQDDRWHPRRVARYAGAVAGPQAPDLLFSDLDLIDGDGERLADSFYRRPGSPFSWPVGLDDADVFLVNPVVGMSMIISRPLAERLVSHGDGPWPMHDWGAVMLCRLYHCRWEFLPEVLGSYRQHGANLRGASSASGARASLGRLRERIRSIHDLGHWCRTHAADDRGGTLVPTTRWQALHCAAVSRNLRWWYRMVLSSLLLLLWPRKGATRD